ALQTEDLFSRFPDITDWLIVDPSGNIVQKSPNAVIHRDNPFIQFIKWTQKKSVDLKLADIQIMELETEKRTVIISFPNSSEVEYFLVLYMDPVERNALHEELNRLNWNDLKQMMEGNDIHEETR
ncbi:MAG TPA: hypothetical protein VFK27_02580, partial [Bacillales bacterium]|nr:hypothetical protein [Bacillales bacterium]